MTGRMRVGLASLLLCAFAVAWPVHADLLVNQRRDKIELEDGTIVECIIIMETPTGILVLLPEKTDGGAGQKIIPRARIKNINKGADEGRMQGFQTETDTARKVIQGTGFRDTLKTAKEAAPVTPGGPIGPIAPIVQPAGTGMGTVPAAYSKPMKLTPGEVVKEYLARYPELKQSAGWLLNDPSRASQWLDKAITSSPEVRARLEELLNRLHQSQPDTLPQGAMVAPGRGAPTRAAPPRGGPAAPRGSTPPAAPPGPTGPPTTTPPGVTPPAPATGTPVAPPKDAKPPNF